MGVAGDEHCDLQGCDGPCHRRRPILLQELADRHILAIALRTGRRAGNSVNWVAAACLAIRRLMRKTIPAASSSRARAY
jgi:hypothetical protein